MKTQLISAIAIIMLFIFPKVNFAQLPDLGAASGFVLYTAGGAFNAEIADISVVTGDVGTNAGAFFGFPPGTLTGQKHVADAVTAQAAIDVASAYNQLSALTCGSVITTTLGNGQVLAPKIYCLGAASTLNGDLTLDGQNDPNAIFIFKINGAFATGNFTNVLLINSASLCNVYWQINGAYTLGGYSVFRGNVIANGAIHLLQDSELYGRALSTAGAIDLHNNIVTIGFPLTASTTWNGSANAEWYNPTNWSDGVPGSNTPVTIPSGLTNYPTITSPAVCQNITIASGASLLDNGSLTVSGTATVQRLITGSSGAWHFLSSPVSSQAIDPAFIATPSTSYDFFTWFEPARTWVNFKNSTVFPTWDYANGSADFLVGRGYLVEYSGTNHTKQFQGNLNNGTISVTLSKSGTGSFAAYNLVGNPYPSAIDWKAADGWTRTSLVANSEGGFDLSIWNDAEGNYGVYNSANLDPNGTHGVSQYIAACQGFMVKAASPGNLIMNDGIRVHSNQEYLKLSNEIPNIFRMKASGSGNTYSDEIVIEFGHQTDISGDEKMYGFYKTAPSLYIVKPTGNYSIDFRGEFVPMTVPVSFIAGIDGHYTLTASQLESFSSTINIALEDLQTGMIQNLMLNPVYTFTASENDDTARFLIHFGGTFNVKEKGRKESLSIYSSGNTVYIDNKSGDLQGKVMVYNMIGQRLICRQLSTNPVTKITLGKGSGCFLIKVITDGDIYSAKVAINQE